MSTSIREQRAHFIPIMTSLYGQLTSRDLNLKHHLRTWLPIHHSRLPHGPSARPAPMESESEIDDAATRESSPNPAVDNASSHPATVPSLLKLFPHKCRLSIVRKPFFVFLVNLQLKVVLNCHNMHLYESSILSQDNDRHST